VFVVTVLLLVVGGMALWTFFEYALHRFAMHELRGRGLPSSEHLLHHADPYSDTGKPFLSWLAMILFAVVLWGPLGWWALGRPLGAVLGVGWLVGYAVYERLHNGAHVRAPWTGYGRWLRRHHFHHHLGHPMSNHGVTVPVWDLVFGTYERPGRLRVPRRMVMPWLVDADGRVRPEYADDYELVGRVGADERTRAIDRARAFANLEPVG